MNKLLLATGNPGKLIEIQDLLEGIELTLITPAQMGIHLEIEEDGNTYADNAAKKAVAFARASGILTMADDSGLEVEALDGRPGVHSHRFSPLPGATDADRRTYLLEQLRGRPQPWRACFHCTVALATPAGEVQFAKGECAGEIISEERGQNGFGYDPIFLIPEIGLTMAELNMSQKNQLSHRARAVRAAIPYLIRFPDHLF